MSTSQTIPQLDVQTAYKCLQTADAGDNWLRAASDRGREQRTAHVPFEDCPYSPERSAGRRAVWQLAWLRQDTYLKARGLD